MLLGGVGHLAEGVLLEEAQLQTEERRNAAAAEDFLEGAVVTPNVVAAEGGDGRTGKRYCCPPLSTSLAHAISLRTTVLASLLSRFPLNGRCSRKLSSTGCPSCDLRLMSQKICAYLSMLE